MSEKNIRGVVALWALGLVALVSTEFALDHYHPVWLAIAMLQASFVLI